MITESHKKFIARNKLRFFTGFGILSVFMGIVSFCLLIKANLYIIGVYVSLPLLGILAFAMAMGCWYLGFLWEMWKMWREEVSHTNIELNPEMLKLCREVSEMRQLLEKK
jgi:hypothetical protein